MKILFDLSNSQHGHSGIQNEMRNMLRVFHMNKYDLSGFLYDNRHKGKYSMLNFDTSDTTSQILSASRALSILSDTAETDVDKKFIAVRLFNKFRNFYINFLKLSFDSVKLNDQMKEVLYRQFIMQDYDIEAFKDFLSSPIYISNFSEHINVYRQLVSSKYPLANIKMDTKDYNFVVTQTEIPSFKYPKDVLKVIRFYDLIPITNPDNVSNSFYRSLLQHRNILTNISQNSIFVSISNTVSEELQKMYPQLKGRCFSIPCTVPLKFKKTIDDQKFKDILSNYSSSIIGRNAVTYPHNLNDNEIKDTKFILFLSTLEPRKNLKTLIKAFNQIKSNTYNGCKPRLLVVGKLGWMYDNMVKDMLPLIKSGELIYLSNPPFEELKYIYSHASVFVLPSFAEGFGLIQVEAMNCGCPVITSDLPVHREVQGDASYFCNPYDPSAFADKIDFVLNPKNKPEIDQMIEKGYEQGYKYREEATSKLWEILFNDLIEKKKKTGKYY